MTTKLIKLYSATYGIEPETTAPIAGQGSNRRYYRLSSPVATVIGTIGDNRAENEAFISLSHHMSQKGLNVPRIIAVSDDAMCYLQSDLGDSSLFDFIAGGRSTGEFSDNEEAMLHATIAGLPALQYKGGEGFDFSKCYPIESFDRHSAMWDLNYFKYCFLKPTGIDFSEPQLEDEFERMCAELLDRNDFDTLMYRDFQSRNVMIKDDQPWFIDFQGARRGPAEYDVASFLWQARAGFPNELRHRLIDTYLKSAQKYININREEFLRQLMLMVLFRQIQTIGAYGFRGLIERKAHFLKSIIPALENVNRHISNNSALAIAYPHLAEVLLNAQIKMKCDELPADQLTITIGSFSYMKGLPVDNSGNGGGFVFDCRGMHNPGRYDEYKKLTGRDQPVIDFLEDRGEVQQFVDNAMKLVAPSIEIYLRRGFTSLQAWFGCTGGQHRSVYCADHLARLIAEKYPDVNIRLIHREQPQLDQHETTK